MTFYPFILALLSGLFRALREVVAKHRMADGYKCLAWACRAYALPALGIGVFYRGIPVLDNSFWTALLIATTIATITTALWMNILKQVSVSVAAPFTALGGAGDLIGAYFLLNETPTIVGVVGVFIIIAALYLLKVDSSMDSVFTPFYKIINSRVFWLILVLITCWSIMNPYLKIGSKASSALFFAFCLHATLSITLGVVYIRPIMEWANNQANYQNTGWFLILGTVSGISILCQYEALRFGLVVYVISLKRTWIILATIFGIYILGEKSTYQKIIAGLLAFAGAVFVLVG